MKNHFIIGTRGSDLALWQARFLQKELSEKGFESELKIIKTKGDQIRHISLEKIEGKGFFTKEIEDALLNNEIDIAVHSHKDLPTESTAGLKIAAVSYREDPSELLLIRKESVDEKRNLFLRENAVVGTSASRRKLQLAFFRPDIAVKDIRGNVPTRIQKLRNGEFDAVLLAAAGVERLNLNCSDLHAIKLSPAEFIPAPAQGVLAYQCRENDDDTVAALKSIHHPDIAEQIFVEREVMRLFKGGCHMPLGMYCTKKGNEFLIWGMQAGNNEEVIKRLFVKKKLIENTAEEIFTKFRQQDTRTVFISTQEKDAELFVKILGAKGFRVNCGSLVTIKELEINSIPETDWIFFTSKNGVRTFCERFTINENKKIAAIGGETAASLRSFGYKVDFIGDGDEILSAANFNQLTGNQSVLFPQALNASGSFQDRISENRKVIHLPVYLNEPMKDAHLDYFDILAFTSALNADAYFKSNKIHPKQIVIAIGESTKKHLEQLGVENVLTPPQKNFMSMADLICGL